MTETTDMTNKPAKRGKGRPKGCKPKTPSSGGQRPRGEFENRRQFIIDQLMQGVAPLTIRRQYMLQWAPISAATYCSDLKSAYQFVNEIVRPTHDELRGMLATYSAKVLDTAMKQLDQGLVRPTEIIKVLEFYSKLYGLDTAASTEDNRPRMMRIQLTHGEGNEDDGIIDITPE